MINNKVLFLIVFIFFGILYAINNQKTVESIEVPTENIYKMDLIQPINFYEDRQQGIKSYLQSVYPTSNFDTLTVSELAKLYNSLWMWYNCSAEWGPYDVVSSYDKNGNAIKEKVCWRKLPGCGTKYPILPFVPQGWIYNFNSYMGVPSDEMIVGNQITFSDSKLDVKDIVGSVPSRTYWFWNNGPGPVWMYQRAIFRYVYNPGFGDVFQRNGVNYQTPSLTPGEITNKNLPIPWKIPDNWWTGVPSGGYLEVTAASEPGLAPSPPLCWFDGWRGSGTWVNVGKTLICRNKVDGVFKMAQEASKTSSGRQQLIKYFNSDDPYEICKKLVSWSKDLYEGRGACPINGPIVYDGRPTSPTYKQKIQFNFCNSNGTNQGSITGLFGQTNMNKAYNFYISDWFDWCGDKTVPMPNSCVDKMRFGTEFMADRQAAIMTFDEPLFALGLYLNYDSIQMPHSSNGNGRYQYEYLELRGYPKEVRNRDYSSFIMTIPQPAPTIVDYRADFMMDYMPKMESLFSYRDILNPNNGKSKPMKLAASWKDSVKVPTTRPGVTETFNTFNINTSKQMDLFYANKASVSYVPINKNNVFWDDGCPVNKSALGYMWEYNITGKDHISDMFTKLSIANFALLGDKNIKNTANFCQGGVGQAIDVNNFKTINSPNDLPFA